MSELADRLAALSTEKRALLERLLAQRRGAAVAVIPRRAVGVRVPLSPAQQRLWFVERLAPETALYTLGAHFRLDGALDADALGAALDEVVRRHEALRTTVIERDGEPEQAIAAPRVGALAVVELAAGAESEAARLAAEEARRPFRVGLEPPLRATLLRLAPDAHVLLLTVHHLVCDGWSMDVLLRELSTLYGAFRRGAASPLAELPLQLADVTEWQRQRLSGDALAADLAYWKDHLAGAPEALELPTDRPRPAAQGHRGGRELALLPEALSAAFAALCRRHDVTLFTGTLAAYQALLHRWSGQDDLVVGTPIAGRGRTETEGLIGLFINTLALRARVSDDPPFSALLRRAHASVQGALAHPELPFERLVEALAPARSLGRAVLFQAMFRLQDGAPEPLALEGVAATPLPVDNGAADLDLSLSLTRGPEGLSCALRYDADLFDAATARRLLGHYRALLEAVVADPELPLSRLPLLSAEERREALVAHNVTDAPIPDVCVHELFEAQADRTPSAVAVGFEGATLSYRELRDRARRLAGRLAAAGVGRGDRVGLHVERSLDMAAAVLGVLASGAAYVPLDPSYPADRLAFMLDDARVAAVITEPHLAAALPPSGARVLFLAEGGAEVPAALRAARPGDPAYVIYTSGSTGRPKGVVIAHRSVVSFLSHLRREPGLSDRDTLLAVTTLSFDIAGLELLLPLVCGARVEIASRATASDGVLLRAALAGCTVMQATPATWRMLLDAGWTGSPTLRVLCGGEALSPELAASLLARAGAVHNLYGPTETTIWSTAQRVAPGEGISIGRPIANTRAYVLDRHLEPTPIGVAGEIWLSGAGVAVGYLRRPELTAERFLPEPFAATPGARMYRTGDVGRRRADGALEHLGRADQQLKLRGHRVEPGEIEAALCAHPAVREAAVVPSPGERLAAFVVARGDAPSGAELRSFLATRLPVYLVPSTFAVLPALPRTPNGKLDRRALVAQVAGAPPEAAPAQAPRTPVEERIAALWADVLGAPGAGIDDDFFAVGGHSLLGARLLARVREAFGIELPLRLLFAAPTVRGLAAAVGEAAAVAHPVAPAAPGDARPLSYAQERLWFLEQLFPGTAAYHMPVTLRLRGPLDVGALARAVDALLGRHEVLRTVLRTERGEPVAVVLEGASAPLALVDATLAELPERLREAQRAPFQLDAEPMLRATLFRLGPDDHALLVLLHHLAADAWSVGILLDDLGALYAGEALPALPIQYADHARWQRRFLEGGALAAQLAYWKKQLAGAPAHLELPLDRARPAERRHAGDARSIMLPTPLVEAVSAVGRRARATLFMTLLAAFEVLLWRTTGQRDFSVGAPVAGRGRIETERLVGLFINTLVLRADLSGEPSFLELVARTRETALDAFTHPDVPFERLVEELAPARSTARSPLVEVLFTLQNAPRRPPALRGLEVSLLPVHTGTSKLDLSLALTPREGGLLAQLEFDADLFEPATIERMLGHFEALLHGAVERPDAPIERLALILSGEIDRRALPARFSPQHRPAPAGAFVAPRDALEAQLAASWERLLGVGRVGAYDNFFDLGGHSLLASRFLADLDRELGRTVSLATLFRAQTVADLASALRAAPAEVPTLIAIQPGRARRPFFCVSRPNVNALGYAALARHLGPDQPVYGLQAHFREEDAALGPYEEAEYGALAAEYLEGVRSVQPEGPYLLGGMCEGAHLAFEMARRLEAEGQRVALLVMLDAWPVENTRSRLWWRVDVYRRQAERQVEAVVHLGPAAWAAARLRRWWRRERDERDDAVTRFETRYWPGAGFVPPAVQARITVLRVSSQPYWRTSDPLMGWGARSRAGVEVHAIGGEHETFLREPYVRGVAATLASAIKGAERRPGG